MHTQTVLPRGVVCSLHHVAFGPADASRAVCRLQASPAARKDKILLECGHAPSLCRMYFFRVIVLSCLIDCC